MPLLAGTTVVTEPPEVDTGPTFPHQELVGVPVFSWIDPDGAEWPLSNPREDVGWFTIMGPSGWGAAPIEITTDQLPRGGESVRAIASKPTTIQWPLEIFGSTHEEFLGRYRRISRAFTLTTRRHRPGRLRVRRPSGEVREIEAFYSDGLGAETAQNHLYARPVITLFCPEGKWRSTTQVVADRTFTPTSTPEDPEDPEEPGTPVNFFYPYLSVTSSNVVGTPGDGGETPGGGGDGGGGGTGDDPAALTTINNPGDCEAWPVWTITGPLTRLRAWNATLDVRFTLTYPLGDQQTITITTDRPTVRGPGDQNLSKYIDWFNTAGTELWPLSDGLNTVGLEVDGAGTNTRVRMAFTPRYDNS
jgi:hypothetical protein